MADDDGEIDLPDLSIEKLWNVAKRHTTDPAELIELVVLSTAGAVTSEDLAVMMAGRRGRAHNDRRRRHSARRTRARRRHPREALMGTNYYLEPPTCECCGQRQQRVHVGKSCHMFRAYVPSIHDDLTGGPSPIGAVTSFAGWAVLIQAKSDEGWSLVDEYGQAQNPDEWLARCRPSSHALERRTSTGLYANSPSGWCTEGIPPFGAAQWHDRYWWLDPDGYEMNAYEFS